MKIKVSCLIVYIIYILVFVSACAQIRYRLNLTDIWGKCYNYALMGILVLSVLYIAHISTKCFNKWSWFLLLLVVYELIATIITGTQASCVEVLRDLATWPLLSVVFCEYSKNEGGTKYFDVITAVGVMSIFLLSIPNIVEHLATYGRHGAVIAPVYFTFTCLPLVYLYCNKKIAVILSIIATLLIVLSTKRAGFLIVVSGIICSYLSSAYLQDKLKENITKTGKRLLIVLAGGLVGYFVLRFTNASVLDRLSTLSSDGGHGRIEIWNAVYSDYQGLSFFKRLFGSGCHAVAYIVNIEGLHLYAHNSFLETLYDYGFVGFCLIIYLCVLLQKRFFDLHKNKSTLAPSFSFTIPCVIGLGMFSYFFEQTNLIMPVCIAWGVCMNCEKT